MKNILPPPTLPVLPLNEVALINSGVNDIYNDTMVDLATQQWLTGLGLDFDVKRPPILFSNDSLWRAVIKVLAFNHRHTREAVRRVMQLLLRPMISQATVLDREYVQNIIIGDTLDVLAGPNLGNYVIAGVTAHELIFVAATFPVVPDAGPIPYAVGLGPAPIVGPTIGTQGRIYTATDGTERLIDQTVSFLNTHTEDLLTQNNTLFPQFGITVFEKNSPIEETKNMAFYDSLQSGLMKLKTVGQSSLSFTHLKYQPIRSSVLTATVSPGALTLDLFSTANFQANAAPVDAIVAGVDSATILQGVNVGTYPITAITPHQITLNTGGAPLVVTTSVANNNFKITPIAVPVGSKGTVFSAGGVVSVTAGPPPFFAVFRCNLVDFTTQVDPNTGTSTGYSVRINRGELTEEVVQVQSLAGLQLSLIADPADPTAQTSLLKFPHETSEVVEIEGLNYSANSTYFIALGTATGGGVNTLVDATNPFLATLLNSADVEILTGAAAGNVRTIIAPFAAGTITVTPNFTVPVGAGDTYRIIKRYIIGIDDILYLDDTSGLPLSNFTAIVDRGTPQEEVLYIGANNITVTPNTLTILNSDAGTAFCAANHSSSFSVEAAQVLVLGCDWDIIETRATGEFSIVSSPDCVPDMDLNSFFLHDNVDLGKAAGGPAHPITVINAGDIEFSLLLSGVSSFETCLENTGDRDGIFCRTLKVGTGATEEEVFATKQKHFTKVAENYTDPVGSPTLILDVEDASQFESIIPLLPFFVVLSRNNSSPLSTAEAGQVVAIDVLNNTFRFAAPLLQYHYSGDPIELRVPVIQISDVFEFGHGLLEDITLLYLDSIYRLADPYFIVPTFTDVPSGNLIELPPNSSYLPITPAQTKKSIFPGSYVYNVAGINYPIIDSISNVITTLPVGPDPTDLTAAYKIPLTQEIIGSRWGAAPVNMGQDVGPGTSEILVADGRLFPDAIQNPFYIVLDHQRNQEEVLNCVGKLAFPVPNYPNASLIQLDPLPIIKFVHYSRKFAPTAQLFPISIVDLEVHKLAVASIFGFGENGGIFIDYGFNDNRKLLYPIEITGTTAVPAFPDQILDVTKTFLDYYADSQALSILGFGAYVVINPATPATTQVRQILSVVANDTLDVVGVWAPAIAAPTPYKIYGYVEVDNSEFGTNLTHVGGDITNIGETIIWHPLREDGVTQEYVKFSSRTGNVLTLLTPTVFKKAHPATTQVILGTGTVGPKTDGSSYQPFLYADFLTALFHKDVGNFGATIKAAGIEIKAEETDA